MYEFIITYECKLYLYGKMTCYCQGCNLDINYNLNEVDNKFLNYIDNTG